MTSTDFGRRYFSRKPYKSLYFWLPTIWLLVVICMALLMGRRLYDHRGSAGIGGGLWWMCLSVAATIILWLRAWRSHSNLYQINLDRRGSDPEYEQRFDAILAQAAYLEYAGLYVTLLVLQSALVGFSKVVGK
jgi:hypothetical protein